MRFLFALFYTRSPDISRAVPKKGLLRKDLAIELILFHGIIIAPSHSWKCNKKRRRFIRP
jgi:hypothetical protein